jgi:bifunctional DNase/RNase
MNTCQSADCEAEFDISYIRVHGTGRTDPAELCQSHWNEHLANCFDEGFRVPHAMSPVAVQVRFIACNVRDNTSQVYLTGDDDKGVLRIDTNFCQAELLDQLIRRATFPRPSIHHAFLVALSALGSKPKNVIIHDFDNLSGAYIAAVTVGTRQLPAEISVELKVSDAIALSILCGAPLLVHAKLIEKLASSGGLGA